LRQDLADYFQDSDPEAEADDAYEAFTHINGTQVFHSVGYRLVGLTVGIALIILNCTSHVREECKSNENAKLN